MALALFEMMLPPSPPFTFYTVTPSSFYTLFLLLTSTFTGRQQMRASFLLVSAACGSFSFCCCCSVKPAVFDLFLALAIAGYVGGIYMIVLVSFRSITSITRLSGDIFILFFFLFLPVSALSVVAGGHCSLFDKENYKNRVIN